MSPKYDFPDFKSLSLNEPLPDKPSDIIRAALADLALVERDNDYKINMGWWYHQFRGVCEVCFAGAVMASRCDNIRDFSEVRTCHFDEQTDAKLNFLDAIRKGQIRTGLLNFHNYNTHVLMTLHNYSLLSHVEVVDYHVDEVLWRAHMNKIADLLQSVGL